jgi:hypothetical protein
MIKGSIILLQTGLIVRIYYILNEEYKSSGYDIEINVLGDLGFTFTEWQGIAV